MAIDPRRNSPVEPGALSALLAEIARAPEPEPGSSWISALRPGARVGKFELVRELGRGGFGVVWEARDLELGRSVAFKAVRAGGNADLREERLLREAEAAAQLSHPNLATLFDLGRAEQGPYLVMELLRGCTLEERLARRTAGLREAIRIAAEVAKGLAHAHAKGVVHRDLKPANVFLCEDGQVKVLDFGLAHAFGQRRRDGGTPAYMAPEQWEGAPEDERTDVFALGVMLYRMLSGELPFPDPDGKDHRSRRPAPALEIAEHPGVGELVAGMLAKRAVERPRDGGEVAAALAAFREELERTAEQGPGGVRTRRRPGLRLVALVALGMLAGAAAAGAVGWWRARAPSGRGEVRAVEVARAPAGEAGTPGGDPPSIAVLPFEDLSPAGDQGHFADGVAEEILGALSRVHGLKVIGRTSSFAFRGKGVDVGSIGQKLGVAHVLEGSLRLDAGRIRVAARLVRAADGVQLWAESIDRPIGGVFAAQEEVARAVAARLGPVHDAGAPPPLHGFTTGPEAYDQYLRGRRAAATLGPRSVSLAIEAFERATALDPTFAPAWVGLAEARAELSFLMDDEPEPVRALARAAADRALSLAPAHGHAHSTRAMVRLWQWEFQGARADAERALALDPGSSTPYRRLGVVLRHVTGRAEPALVLLLRATELDPLAASGWYQLGFTQDLAGSTEEARASYGRALVVDPEHEHTLLGLGDLELGAGRPDEARRWYERSRVESNRMFGRALVAQASGRSEDARRALQEYLRRYPHLSFEAALIHAARGEADAAFAALERGIAARHQGLVNVREYRGLQPLHGDPRWASLLRRMGFPED